MTNGMIIGFLGKGGSGKTTLATLMTKYLLEKGNNVLAIDADHNMDFSYNLGVQENIPYFGQSMSHIKQHIGIDPDIKKHYREAFILGPKRRFGIFPNDEYSKEYTVVVNNNLNVMVAGPHTEEIWEGDKCSHSLFTALKIFLPFMDLKNNEFVVIDEKAGMDSVGTMVPMGFDVAIVVTEPTIHSTKTANQITNGLQKYGTPFILVGNKIVNEEQKEFLKNNLWTPATAVFEYDLTKTSPTEISVSDTENFEKILATAKKLCEGSTHREKRSTRYWNK